MIKKRVLIVDDNKTDLFILEKFIKELGYVPVTSSNTIDALDLVKFYSFSLILLNINFSSSEGYRFANKVKQVEISKTPIIMMSGGQLKKKDILKAISHGAVDFIVKPIKFVILEQKVSVLKKKDMDLLKSNLGQ